MGIFGRASQKASARQPSPSRLLLALVAVLAACGGTSPGPPVRAGAEIVVGTALSLSGSLAGEGQLTRQGYQMWLDWVDRRGGIEVAGVRHPVRLVVRDDQSKPAVAASMAAELIQRDGAQFLLGPYGSDNTASVAAVAEQYRVPLVEGNGGAQAIFERGYRYTFGVLSLTDRYMTGIMEMATRLVTRPRTIALLYADDTFSMEVAESVEARAPDDGFQVVFSQRYPAGSADVMQLVARAGAARPDILMNSGHLVEAVAIHRAARALAVDAAMFAYSVGPSTQDFISQLGPDADFVFVGAQWTPQVRYVPQVYLTVPDYIAAYKRRFRTLTGPPYQAAGATAAALALQRAIETAGSIEQREVRNALVGLDVMTFYGRIAFDGRGANIFKPMIVQQIQHSRHHTVYPPEVADMSPAYPTPPWGAR